MATVLGINAVFHDPAAAIVVDGVTLAAAEEERFSRRKHGKTPVPFSTWELPEQAARWCLAEAAFPGVERHRADAEAAAEPGDTQAALFLTLDLAAPPFAPCLATCRGSESDHERSPGDDVGLRD